MDYSDIHDAANRRALSAVPVCDRMERKRILHRWDGVKPRCNLARWHQLCNNHEPDNWPANNGVVCDCLEWHDILRGRISDECCINFTGWNYMDAAGAADIGSVGRDSGGRGGNFQPCKPQPTFAGDVHSL